MRERKSIPAKWRPGNIRRWGMCAEMGTGFWLGRRLPGKAGGNRGVAGEGGNRNIQPAEKKTKARSTGLIGRDTKMGRVRVQHWVNARLRGDRTIKRGGGSQVKHPGKVFLGLRANGNSGKMGMDTT